MTHLGVGLLSTSNELSASGQRLRLAAGRSAALLTQVPDARAHVPGLAWNVADTAVLLTGP